MEAKFGGNAHHFYGPVVSDLKVVGKRSMEWDLNDWKWDGDMFVASRMDSASKQLFPVGSEIPVNAGSSNISGEIGLGNDKARREFEKRRRMIVVEDEEMNDEVGSLNLKLGRQVYPIMEVEKENWEDKSGKKTKVLGATSNRAVCQVDDCKADLSEAKDYHRRHKVCDVHSKASKALVGNVMQRFCQQCSRFHVLQEFDDGKRSCRRRLAGHNRRRRKTHPDNVVNGSSLNDEQGSSYLLISLLRILSNMHSSSSEQSKNQDLLSHLLRNLASLAGTTNGRNLTELLQGSQDLLNAGTSIGTSEKVPNLISNGAGSAIPGSAHMIDDCAHLQKAPRLMGQCVGVPATELVEKRVSTDYAQDGTPSASQSKILDSIASKAKAQERSGGRIELNSIDLNNVYDDSHDSIENLERSHVPANPGIGSCGYPLLVQNDSHKSSPPQISGNSDSASGQSLSSSCGEVQSRTDRIVFKLFEKDPNDFPLVLRTKILDWLSHSPTDIESYIRPGCIILTIYLRMGKPMWEELCRDLGSSLSRLLDVSSDNFWRTGWVYARVQHHVSFICDGQVVLDTPLPLKNLNNCRILSIKPIAVPVYERAQFVVKCFNLAWSTTRLLCALEGKYLVQETCYDLMEAADAFAEHDEIQCLSFPCSIPNVTGRGFIEVEDNGLSSSFFPFIVAEQDVCSEICTLEGVIEVETTNDKKEENEMTEAKNQALDFINEMGWLLHRSYLRSRLGNKDPNLNLFSFNRFKWLMEFSMDRDWCAVVEKLLGVIFNGTVDLGEHPSIELALLELGLLHRAVRRNCRPMVELLLMYLPYQGLDKPGFEQKQQVDSSLNSFIFKPDVIGPGGLTPLHTAAGRDGSDDVLDALTDDPGMVGIEAWNKARDSTGLTPNDYACLQGRPSYIHLVQKKINKKLQSGHVVVDIPSALPGCNSKQKASDGPKMGKAAGFVTEKIKTKGMLQHPQCQFCKQKLAYGKLRPSLAYRPAMLSMVAIAAVCVCVALLFKTLPEVQYASPFRWELLKYGSS